MLLNQSHTKQAIKGAFKELRPHLGEMRVPADVLAHYNRLLNEWITSDVQSHTGPGRTFRPASMIIKRHKTRTVSRGCKV